MSRAALLVGISNYFHLPRLSSSDNDANDVYNLLIKYGEFDTINLLPLINSDEKNTTGHIVGKETPVSYSDLRKALINLFTPPGDQHPETALFYFSGHGQREASGLGEGYLAVSDSMTEDYGNMGISLSWLSRLLGLSKVRNQIIILDCCYSGAFDIRQADPITGNGCNRCFIGACREHQLAYANEKHGVLTTALLKALDPNSSPSGRVNNRILVDKVEKLCGQSGLQSFCCYNPSNERFDITRLPIPAPSVLPRQRVCMISSEYPPHVSGGLGVHVNQLTREMAEIADIDIFIPHQQVEYTAPFAGIHIHPHTACEANYDDQLSWLYFSHEASLLVKDTFPKPAKPTVIHCHDWVTVLCGIKCRWLFGVPLIFHVHLPNRTPFCSSVENLGILCADLVTVSSQVMREELHNRFPNKEIRVIPNGVDTEIFKQGESNHFADQYILLVGRLVEQKGVDYLLRAFVHIQKKFPTVRLKIVGDGPCRIGYEQLADCLLIRDQVEFLGWTASSLELSKIYQGAVVVAMPSIYEPFGMTALEAMACFRPVVASKTGGLQDFVKHGETGYLSRPKDHLDLAQWIIRLLDRVELRQTLGSNAGKAVHGFTTYQWSTIAKQFVRIYEEISQLRLDFNKPELAETYLDQIRKFAPNLKWEILNNIFVRG